MTPEPVIADNVYRRRKPSNLDFMVVVVAMLSLFVGLGAAAAWSTYIFRTQRIQPIVITACEPDKPGCTRTFVELNDTFQTDEIVYLVGQVCNSSTRPRSYEILIAWHDVSSPLEIPVVDSEVEWLPGCKPYDFPFPVPEQVTALAGPGESVGRWKIVGRAVPIDDERLREFTWDLTAAVELINPPAE